MYTGRRSAAGAACRAVFVERAWADWAAVRESAHRSPEGQLTAIQDSLTKSMTYAVSGAAVGDVEQLWSSSFSSIKRKRGARGRYDGAGVPQMILATAQPRRGSGCTPCARH